jgi:hypothetical protein
MILNEKRLDEHKKLVNWKNSYKSVVLWLIAGDSSFALILFLNITDLVEEGSSTKNGIMTEK